MKHLKSVPFFARKSVRLICACILLAGAVFCVYQMGIFSPGPELETPVSEPESQPAVSSALPPAVLPGAEESSAAISSEEVSSDDELPHDRLFITVERQKYKDGDLRLIIPKLSVDTPVLGQDWKKADGSIYPSYTDLHKGACLYQFAQLPGEGDRNVSISAHRNGVKNGKPTDDALFYYLDTLLSGDYLYLSDKEQIYRYTLEDLFVVEETDWGPIYSQGYSCLTLTTCTPVGVATHRLVARGRLEQTFPYAEDFAYLEAAPDSGSSQESSSSA